jgi:hypothetical protein
VDGTNSKGFEMSKAAAEAVPTARKRATPRKAAEPLTQVKKMALAMPGRIQRLSDPEMADRMAAFNAKLGSDPEFALQMLKSAGLVNKKGQLKKSFGG